MTARQSSFIRTLAEERDYDRTNMADEDRRKADYVTRLVGGNAPQPNPAQVDSVIKWLRSQPVKEGVTTPVRTSQPDVADGRYAVELGSVLRFFRVDRPTEGRWAGRLFLSEVIGGEARGRSIRENGEKALVLNAINDDAMASRVRYGVEIGRCGYCNRTLTDEDSRLAGIGPDCAEQHGVDRRPLIAAARELVPA